MLNVGYYVSSIDGSSKCLMLGPFNTHAEALAHVDDCFKACDKVDPRAWFRSWGTCRLETEKEFPAGRANTLLGFVVNRQEKAALNMTWSPATARRRVGGTMGS